MQNSYNPGMFREQTLRRQFEFCRHRSGIRVPATGRETAVQNAGVLLCTRYNGAWYRISLFLYARKELCTEVHRKINEDANECGRQVTEANNGRRSPVRTHVQPAFSEAFPAVEFETFRCVGGRWKHG